MSIRQPLCPPTCGVKALALPVDSLVSNWAYMVMASLAWTLKVWSALWLPEGGGRCIAC